MLHTVYTSQFCHNKFGKHSEILPLTWNHYEDISFIFIDLVCFWWMITIFALPAAATQTFSRSVTFCALDMSFTETAEIIQQIREYYEKANLDNTDLRLREKLTLEDDSVTLELTDEFDLTALKQGPEIATTLWYSMTIFEDTPISRIILRFGDRERVLTVSGVDSDRVYGLVSSVSRQIERIGCSLGGNRTRSNLGFGLLFLSLLLSFAASMTNRPRLQVVVLVATISVPIIIFALPWADWLPGTVIRLHPISIWDQLEPYLAVLTVLGSLCGIAALIHQIYSGRDGKTDQ